jgi:Glycosyltransferase
VNRMTKDKRNILIITGRYLPGYKDGGPVRSIKNLVDYLGDQYNFKILTCDRDHGDPEAYPNVKIHDWNKVGNAQVYYVPPKGFTRSTIKKLASQVDLVYVCGCFSDYAINTLLLKRLGLIKKPVFVAAMGLFSPMEFRLKYKKKKLFTTLFNMTGMFKNIYWSATSEMEVKEISEQVRTFNNFVIAEDLPRRVEDTLIDKVKTEGNLKVVWISRIAPKKNLIGAIEVLKRVRSHIEFTIYGPIHEPKYWEACQAELQQLPPNVKWTYAGNVDSEQVVETLREHHVFLFPTLGENYGHVIQEALSAGCYTLLSDQTPWQDLSQYGAGKVFRVDDIQGFVDEIERYAQLDHEQFSRRTKDVIAYVMNNNKLKVSHTGYHHIFGRGVVQ